MFASAQDGRCSGKQNFGLTCDQKGAVLVDTGRLQHRTVFDLVDGQDLDAGGDGVADAHRGEEFQRLAHIDGAWAGQLHADDGGNQPGREHPVGDTATEPSGFGVLLVDMGGVQITGQPGKGIYIPFGNGLGEAGATTPS